MPSFAQQLSDKLTLRGVTLERVQAGTRASVRGHMNRLHGDLVRLAGKRDIPESGPRRTKALRKLESELNAITLAAYRDIERTIRSDMIAVRRLEARAVARLGKDVTGLDIFSHKFLEFENPKDLLIDSGGSEGQPLAVWLRGQRTTLRRRFMGAMRLGTRRGEGPGALADRVRGVPIRSAGGAVVRRGGRIVRGPALLGRARQWADSLAHSATNAAINSGREALFRKNSNIVLGFAANTIRDLRTSLICIARTGARWFIDGRPMPGSTRQEPFPGRPPWHFWCRTFLDPIFMPYAELVRRARGQLRRDLRALTPEQRACFDGSVPKHEPFDILLESLPEAEQRSAIGAGRWRMWKSGELALADLIDETGRPLTIPELEAAEAA